MAERSILDRLRRTFWRDRPAATAPVCPWCERPLLWSDEVVLFQGERHHADCAIARLAQQR
jgi:hypothetical protein